ncbi:MAG TPA: hypothetical protein VLJ37_06905 [bacterium]|nr:hypothetical protein [bacterium]
MKKILIVALLAVLPVVFAGPAFSKGRGVRDLVGEQSGWTKGLINSKAFAGKTILVEIADQRKSTKVGDLFDTVQSVLSASQRSIFVDPLLLAEHQNAAYVTVEVDGAVLKSVGLSSQPPAEQKGVAALVLTFKGDTTLPVQVLANIKPQ